MYGGMWNSELVFLLETEACSKPTLPQPVSQCDPAVGRGVRLCGGCRHQCQRPISRRRGGRHCHSRQGRPVEVLRQVHRQEVHATATCGLAKPLVVTITLASNFRCHTLRLPEAYTERGVHSLVQKGRFPIAISAQLYFLLRSFTSSGGRTSAPLLEAPSTRREGAFKDTF